MKLRALVVSLSLLAACGKTVGTLVTVDVDSATPLPTAASLSVDAVVGGQRRHVAVPLATPGFPPAHSFNLQVAPATTGQLSLHIDVLDAGGAIVASGEGTVTLARGSRVPLAIALAPMGIGGNGGDGADLASAPPADAGVGPDMAPCASGQHVCGGGCVANDVSACGDSCAVCAVPAHATSASCDGVSCGVVCAAGYHDCGGSCVSNTSTDSCGPSSCTACTAPTGGTATCDGMQCGGSCPSGQKLCAGDCIAANAPCNGTCPTGTHDCNGLCESDTSTNSCGTMCMSCMPPANSTPTCGGTPPGCGFACNPGYKTCSGGCIPTASCCTAADCTAPANAVATCSGGSCGFSCNGGYKACNGACIPSASCCTAGDCTPPANGVATCDGNGSCGFTCNGGYKACNGACIASSGCCSSSDCPAVANGTVSCSAGHTCVSSCNSGYKSCSNACIASASCCTAADCTPPQNGTATCTAGSCGFTCNGGYKACSGACIVAGGCCTAADCPAQPNATMSCSASHVCVASCNSGYKACSGACIASASCCTASDCTPPAHATASCSDGSCAFTCNSGYVTVGNACDVAAPRPTSPPSTSRATTRTPLLQWQLPAGVSGAQITLCADRACATKLGTFTATGSSYQPALSVSGNILYWKLNGTIGSTVGGLSSPTWEVFLPAKSASYANAFGSVLDVNGDGVGDVIVGSFQGEKAYVVQGAKSGPDFAHQTILSTSASNAGFGQGVANAGDVDGDGFGDVIVTLWKAGAAQIFHGSAAGVATTPLNTINYAPQSGAHAAAGIGDINGDGYADIAIGVENLQGGPDHVYLFYGGAKGVSSSPAVTLTGPTGQLYGIDIYPLGDIDGDHLADFEVATQNDDTAYIYFGSATAGVRNPTAPLTYAGAANSRYGFSASAGDVNGDGLSDFLLGGGAADLYLGQKGGNPTVQSIAMPSSGHAGLFGNVVGVCGDLNHDGYADLVIGDGGVVFYYAGGANGPSPVATAITARRATAASPRRSAPPATSTATAGTTSSSPRRASAPAVSSRSTRAAPAG